MGDAHRAPRARGERRRHTITNGVDCDLVSEGSGGFSTLPGIGLGPHAWSPGPPLCLGGGSQAWVLGDLWLECELITNICPRVWV